MKKPKHIFIALSFILALIAVRFIFFNPAGWWRFSTEGETYLSPKLYKNLVISGNQNGELFAVEKRTGEQKWKYKTEHEISSQITIEDEKVLFTTTDGILISLNAKTGEEKWKFEKENNYAFYSDLKVHKNLVLVGDAGGTLYAVKVANGELEWKFDSEPIVTRTDVTSESGWNWLVSYRIKGDTVFFASRDGNLYALSAKSGTLKWKFDSGSPASSSPEFLGKMVFFGNKNGDSFALNQKDGELIWKETGDGDSLTCTQPHKRSFSPVVKIPWEILHLSSSFIIEVYENGDIVKRRIANAEEQWRIKTGNKGVSCPVNWFSAFYFVDSQGVLRVLDEEDGKEYWVVKTTGPIRAHPRLSYRPVSFTFSPLKLFINSPILFLGNEYGRFYAINARTGDEIWKFDVSGGIYSPPAKDKTHIYFTSTDGGLYKVQALSGKLNRWLKSVKFNVAQSRQNVGSHQIIELTITHDDEWYTNPWKEVQVQTDFIHQSGDKITIQGFYYDRNTWKVRFNPPKKGEWEWNLEFKLPDKTFTHSGKFKSETDTHAAFLKISEQNPRRLTLDNGEIFNGLGIQDAIKDYNHNGTPLDDWAIGDDRDKIIDLQTYLATQDTKGGFNLFRFGLNNASSFSFWNGIGIYSKYPIRQGKWADTFIQALKDNNFQVWITLFGNNTLFDKSMGLMKKKALQDYIEYVVARYGAYVSVWEIVNEAYVTDEAVNLMANEIKKLDHEKRPISISWELPDLEEIDIISPHWYETEEIGVSDLAILEQINKYEEYQKPIVFGEQGNKEENWDETSAERMRIRSWTAFFNEAILIFWNQSGRKDYLAPSVGNANIFIGEEERSYMKILQDFTKNTSLTAKKVFLPISNTSVRSYGLESEKELLGYFFHYTNQNNPTSFNFKLTLPRQSLLTWIDPATGEVIKTSRLPAGPQTISSPAFSIDLALKVYFDR